MTSGFADRFGQGRALRSVERFSAESPANSRLSAFRVYRTPRAIPLSTISRPSRKSVIGAEPPTPAMPRLELRDRQNLLACQAGAPSFCPDPALVAAPN